MKGDFEWAVEQMKEGKKVANPFTFREMQILDGWFVEKVDYYNQKYNFSLREIESTDWVLVNEDKDWTLIDKIEKNEVALYPDGTIRSDGLFDIVDVKKCRDLIIEDFYKQKPITDFKIKDIVHIINKRFGDLE
jgi:hypothetical protein